MRRERNQLLTIVICFWFLAGMIPTMKAQNMLIPQPVERTDRAGVFAPDGKTTYYINLQGASRQMLTTQLELLPFAVKASNSRQKNNQIALLLDKKLGKSLPAEGYELTVSKSGVVIQAPTEKGLFYGLQSLRQLAIEKRDGDKVVLSNVVIRDYPRFPYRGLHLDVSRHFYSKEFIKKQLDVMAFYKLNNFHWHLTDGAGWRLEIKAYPELTTQAAWRHGKWREWWNSDRHYASINDEGVYGGFYTQDDVREIVAYAAQRNITVIPEIEMPGHSEEVLAVYPHLSCAGKPYSGGEFCVGNEEVFTFLETVLKEVMELFPSEYIHIGGDEAGKDNWKKCPKCQQRIKDNNLKDEHELQSYMIRRMERFLSSHNRKLLGWDEILEGGLAPNATVMSWRGEQGGIDAAKMGHDVIMTPGEFCYFDQYQDNPMTQPEAIGGYLTIDKVYSYNPVPLVLTDQEKKHIQGVQANVWTEYMPTYEHTERMIYPRLLTLSEVAWTPVAQKDWAVFKTKLDAHYAWLAGQGVSVSPLSTEIKSSREVDLPNRIVKLSLFNDVDQAIFYYTINGVDPNLASEQYNQPLEIKETTVVKARLYKHNKPLGEVQSFVVDIHKALGKPITVTGINSGYPAAGQISLVDGKVGTFAYKDQIWQGYTQPMTALIDLGTIQPIHYVKARFMQLVGPWIWLPSKVKVSVSDDNINFTEIAVDTHDVPGDTDTLLFRILGFEGKSSGRYIKFEAIPYAKYGAVMFTDEIVVY